MGIPDKGVFMDSMYRLHYQDGKWTLLNHIETKVTPTFQEQLTWIIFQKN